MAKNPKAPIDTDGKKNPPGESPSTKLPSFTPEQLIAGFGDKGPFNYNCECPSCGSKFQAGPFAVPPAPEQPMTCGMCNRGGIPFRAMQDGFQNQQRFFGDMIECQRPKCGQKYQPIMEGPSGYDERTGKGGMRRACPKCGWYVPTKRPTPNSAEDEKTDMNKILA